MNSPTATDGAATSERLPEDRQAAESPTAPADSSPPPLDWQSLLSRCMGNEAFARTIVAKFQKRLADELPQLEATINARQAELAAFAAHRLKGAAATVSAEAVRQIAARLEGVARAGDVAAAAECVARLHGELGRLADYTAHGLPAAGAPGSAL